MLRFTYSPIIASEIKESDLTAQQRWETEGGNTGESRQLPVNRRKVIVKGETGPNCAVAVLTRRYRVLLQAVRHARG